MLEYSDLSATEAGAGDDGGVVELVAENEAAVIDKGRDHSAVGHESLCRE